MFVFVESEAPFVVVLPRRGCAMHRMTPVCVGNSGQWVRSLSVCVSGPQNRKRSLEGKFPFRAELAPLSRHNHGATGGDHSTKELPCILYQTPRALLASVSLLVERAGLFGDKHG